MAAIAGKKATRPVVVIGAGIQGCATAFFLSQRGIGVTVIEKDHVARHASGVNAGGVRRLGRAIAEVPLSLAAMDWWQQIDDLLGLKAGFKRQCYIKLALDDAGTALAANRLADMQQAGFDHEVWLSRDDLVKRLPAAPKTAQGGILVEGDGWALPWQITRGFYDKAIRQGAVFHQQERVISIDRVADHWRITPDKRIVETDSIVNCAGAWGQQIAAMLDETLPVDAHAPLLVVTERRPLFLNAVIGILGDTLSFKQLDNGAMVIGGGIRGRAIPETNQTIVPPHGLRAFIINALRVFPHLQDCSVLRAWGGIEGYTPDQLPIIGRGQQPGIIHGFGFSAHGFQLGPAVGEALADLVTSQQPRVNLDAFSPRRFDPC